MLENRCNLRDQLQLNLAMSWRLMNQQRTSLHRSLLKVNRNHSHLMSRRIWVSCCQWIISSMPMKSLNNSNLINYMENLVVPVLLQVFNLIFKITPNSGCLEDKEAGNSTNHQFSIISKNPPGIIPICLAWKMPLPSRLHTEWAWQISTMDTWPRQELVHRDKSIKRSSTITLLKEIEACKA